MHIAKAGLTLDRLGYSSSERVLILAKDPAYGLGLPPNQRHLPDKQES
jgi:hypothetical protein